MGANTIVSLPFIISYCVIILLIALIFGLRLFLKVQPILNDIMNIRNYLDKYNDNRIDFRNQLQDINEKMSNTESLSTIWKKILECVILPTNTNSADPILHTQKCSYYINFEEIVIPRITFRFYQEIPNYLTVSGIIGTFLGLTAGIFLAKDGLSSEEVTQVQRALGEVLSRVGCI